MRTSILVVVGVLLGACATVGDAPEHAFVLPQPTSSPIEVCWLETGGATVSGGFGAGGVTQAQNWQITSSVLLVRHPKGDLLIDTGISPRASEEGAALSGWPRFVFDQTAGRNERRGELRELLEKAGVTQVSAVVLSHAHPDHAGGLVDLPDVPVWVGAPEVQLIEQALVHPTNVVLPAHAKALQSRVRPIEFEPHPYENYDQSWDVFGDGTVVVVPTFGHTPGSVATFISLGATQRFMHVGDLINLEESIDRRVGKSWLMRQLTDEDVAKTEGEVAKLIQLHRLDPAVTILPAHDRPVWQRLFGAPNACIRSP